MESTKYVESKTYFFSLTSSFRGRQELQQPDGVLEGRVPAQAHQSRQFLDPRVQRFVVQGLYKAS